PRPLDGPSPRGCFFHAARNSRQQVLRRECSWSWFSSLPWVVEVRLLRHSIVLRLCYRLGKRPAQESGTVNCIGLACTRLSVVNVSTEGEPLFIVTPAHGRLIVNGSTAGRVAPARTDILTVFNNARHRRIAAGIREHFCTPRFVGLCVVVNEWDAFGVVEVSRLLAVRTPRFCVDY